MTRGALLRAMRQRLRDAGIESDGLDARLLVLHGLMIDEMALVRDPDMAVTTQDIRAVEALIARRAAHEPVARILGEQEFYGLPFLLGPDTLIPRPETEMLVDEALRRIDDAAPARLLDLGTGTGCILLAILHARPHATGTGIDTAAGAAGVARRNAARLGLEARAEIKMGHWTEGLNGPFDLIVSNPPYIGRAVVPTLAPEVAQHDPVLALNGGPDGLDAYRAIIPALPGLLAPDGAVLLEIGFDQGGAVRGLAEKAGLAVASVSQDLAGHDRMVVLTLPSPAS